MEGYKIVNNWHSLTIYTCECIFLWSHPAIYNTQIQIFYKFKKSIAIYIFNFV